MTKQGPLSESLRASTILYWGSPSTQGHMQDAFLPRMKVIMRSRQNFHRPRAMTVAGAIGSSWRLPTRLKFSIALPVYLHQYWKNITGLEDTLIVIS
jgi:hypothetical protein